MATKKSEKDVTNQQSAGGNWEVHKQLYNGRGLGVDSNMQLSVLHRSHRSLYSPHLLAPHACLFAFCVFSFFLKGVFDIEKIGEKGFLYFLCLDEGIFQNTFFFDRQTDPPTCLESSLLYQTCPKKSFCS